MPSHLQTHHLSKWYENCRLCPRACGVNRAGASGRTGRCGETHRLRVAYIGPHHGEEPPISGRCGSGTVFFTGCPLQCSFCQNHQISRGAVGTHVTEAQLVDALTAMIAHQHVHNINFVTPDHFFPHVFRVSCRLREQGYDIPLVYNLSGYQSTELLKLAEDHADIYLPDFKYSDRRLAGKLSRCDHYPQVALSAIAEMVRQKGFLDAATHETETARKGVLVRHLILPGHVRNSMDALSMLYVEFGKDLPISLMSQYHPVCRHEDRNLNRFVHPHEFQEVYRHAQELGFSHMYIQFPEKPHLPSPGPSGFLPDFRRDNPFLQP